MAPLRSDLPGLAIHLFDGAAHAIFIGLLHLPDLAFDLDFLLLCLLCSSRGTGGAARCRGKRIRPAAAK